MDQVMFQVSMLPIRLLNNFLLHYWYSLMNCLLLLRMQPLSEVLLQTPAQVQDLP